MLVGLIRELKNLEDSEKAKILQKFFKTGKGEYGEGDIFLGITVPDQRKTAKKYTGLNLNQIQILLNSKIHEHRLIGLLILIEKYKQTNSKKKIFDFYMINYNKINNWDLVDLSAPKIPGDYLLDKDKKILYEYAKSNHLWKKRISIISTYNFIKNNMYEDTINLSKILTNDEHDLIQKAVGWMLREIGKKDQKILESFLKKNHKTMPRTMLRYSIEKLSEEKKAYYMNK
jgi:3-methyladenine DNA glycosylase AlkD